MVVGRAPWAVAGVVGAATVATLVGCGSDSATAPAGTRVDTVAAVSLYTGTLVNSFGVTNFLGTWQIEVGDLDASESGETERGVVTFDVSTLEGDSARSAILRLDECAVSGAPFASLGAVVVDHVPVGTPPGEGQSTGPALLSDLGTIAQDTTTGFKTLDIQPAVEADMADSSIYTQYRLRFSTADGNSNGISDYVDFRTATASHCSGDPTRAPILIIRY
jgi:hypothetical protein